MPEFTTAERERLRSQALQMRVPAIRTRISAAMTFCDVTENQAHWYPPDLARASLRRIWHSIGELQEHIEDRRQVGPGPLRNCKMDWIR